MKMIRVILPFLMLLVGQTSASLKCYECESDAFDGENYKVASNCYKIDSNSAGNIHKRDCESCLTTFELEDGIPKKINRTCARGKKGETCVTKINASGDPVDYTTCHYQCTADSCNNVDLSTLKRCNSDCGRPNGTGYCDYIIGQCTCQNDYRGKDCSISPDPRTRKCVQCDSQVHENCRNEKRGYFCPNNELFCSATQTWVVEEGEVKKNVFIRGCSKEYVAVDQCDFSNIFQDEGIEKEGYSEYTCYSTCNIDNCNVDIPNGIIDGKEMPLMKCYQCSKTVYDEAHNCSSEYCPMGSTHCKSTVEYTISSEGYSKDHDPGWGFGSIVRECLTESEAKTVKTGCTETEFGDVGLKKVVCEETCEEDACNDGWPTRPKCNQCDKRNVCNNGETKKPCPSPAEDYCTIQHGGYSIDPIDEQDLIKAGIKYLKKSSGALIVAGLVSDIAINTGPPKNLVRGCSDVSLGNGCSWTDSGVSCNYTCNTEGCNYGNESESTRPINHFALILLCVISWNLAR